MISDFQQELAEVRDIMNSNKAIQEKIIEETSKRESEKIEKTLVNNLGTFSNNSDSCTPLSQSNSINDYKWKPEPQKERVSGNYHQTPLCSGDYMDYISPSGVALPYDYMIDRRYGLSNVDSNRINLGLF